MTNSPTLGEEGLRALRAHAQLLDRRKPDLSSDEIVRRVCGVQAQEIPSAALALSARAVGLTSNDVDEARRSAPLAVKKRVLVGPERPPPQVPRRSTAASSCLTARPRCVSHERLARRRRLPGPKRRPCPG